MRYDVVYLVNNSNEDYKDSFDGEAYVVPAQGFAALTDRVGSHFLTHNPKLELFTDFDACQARLSQLGFISYSKEITDEDKAEKEPEVPKVEVSPKPKKK